MRGASNKNRFLLLDSMLRPRTRRLRMRLVAALLMLLFATAETSTATAAGGRDVVTFNFGWKHRTGLSEWAIPDSEPPTRPDPGWHPPEVHAVYDDAGWDDVRLPHDGLIATAPSSTGKACPDGCSGKSYIPRHVLWYRKKFALPEEWGPPSTSASAVWLEFDGSFRNTTVWINGDIVARHECGYTPFRVNLHDLPSVKYGGSPPSSSSSASSASVAQQDENNAAAATPNANNVIAVFVDPDNGDEGGRERGSGWWYEGGGLYRNVRLVRTRTRVRVEPDGLFASSKVTLRRNDGDGHGDRTSDANDDGHTLTGESAVVSVRASVIGGEGEARERNLRDGAPDGKDGGVCAAFKIAAPDGSIVTKTDPFPLTFDAAGAASVRGSIPVASPELWTLQNPALYEITVTLRRCDSAAPRTGDEDDDDEEELDAVTTTHGFRTLRHDASSGFFLNGRHFKVRGFCDHDTFAVTGMAVPDRLNLFRAQASRSVGGNGRRTSHNPPDPSLLDIYDRLGTVVIDENRLFDNRTAYVQNFVDLVRRDRNHPSVVVWSFCNEAGCEGVHEDGGPAFQDAATSLDGSRPTLANMFTYNDLLSNTVDVQGFSHQNRDKLDACHAAMPAKPIYMSECCSCNTMRDEDIGSETTRDNPHDARTQISFNARCLESNSAVNASDGASYASGTMVWTLFDYYGEPPKGGPEVSSTYGQFDLCGFPKAAAFWFRTQWLLGVPDGAADKPFPTRGRYEVSIVESWESPDSWNETRGKGTRTIHVYTNAPFVELFVNNKAVGSGVRRVVPMREGPGSYAEFVDVPWEAGVLTAVARDSGVAKEVGGGRHSAVAPPPAAAAARADRRTNGHPTRLVLTLDAPSSLTGTGSALLLDGQDAALIRATVVDDAGATVHLSTHNVTFRVTSGPGYVQGSHNGDPHCHEPNDAPWHSAYHGLVRAVVRVAPWAVAGVPCGERELLRRIDARGPMAATAALDSASGGCRRREGQRNPSLDPAEEEGCDDIIIEATSPGLAPAAPLRIPTTANPAAGSVLGVARASAGREVDFFVRGGEYTTPSSSSPRNAAGQDAAATQVS